jgi:hypothetical protein
MASNTDIHILNNIAHSPLLHSNSFTMSMKSKSLLLDKYWVTFIDDYSRHYTVIPLKKKSEVSLLSSLSRLMLRIIMV